MTQQEMKKLKKERLGNYLNPSEMAYRDLCRTIRLQEGKQKPKDDDTLYKFRKVVVGEIDTALTALREIKSEEAFDKWHEGVCDLIIGVSGGERQNASNPCEEYTALYKPFTYGQSQKWVNMTLKNAYLLTDAIDIYYEHLHCPVDGRIIAAAEDINVIVGKEAIAIPDKVWSQWEFNHYKLFQRQLQKALEISLMDFEFSVWPLYQGVENMNKKARVENLKKHKDKLAEMIKPD